MASKYRLPLLLHRRFQSGGVIKCTNIIRSDLDNALKKLYAKHASVPIVIGKQRIFTGDEQDLKMPHNHRRSVAKFSYATKNHIEFAVENAVKVQEEWANTDVEFRANCCRKAANILATPEKTIELMSAIMLGQAKTLHETERDACRLIRMLRNIADELINVSKTNLSSHSKSLVPNFTLRPLDGFVACTGPINMTWVAAHLALVPLIMGNAVLWRPPRVCVHSTYLVFSAMIEAGIPKNALQFLPSNYRLFLDTVIKSPYLAGINYAGRVHTLRTVWHDMAIRLVHYKCFPRLVGECDNKGFHFIHESADMDLVVNYTIRAAYRYSGQRPYGCARLYVPDSIWSELSCRLQASVARLKIGDPTDYECFASAIIHPDIYEDVVKYLKYAESSEDCDMISGGNYNKSHGYFVEPTIVECRDPGNRLMVDDIMGPVLGVYVYKKESLNETLDIVRNSQKFGGCGSIFAEDERVLPNLIQRLRMTASNLYINNQCCGSPLSHLPFSGNRLSGTNDKNGPAHYLLRFAAPQIVEKIVGEIRLQ